MTTTATPTLAAVLEMAMSGKLDDLRVSLPGRVISYDKTKQRCDVQPLVSDRFEDENEERKTVTLPVLNDVPVIFPGAGAFRLIFPIKKGDTVLLVFCSSSIARWKIGGDIVDPGDDRHHALADAVALPGLFDFAHVPTSNPSDDHMELISSGEIRAGGTGHLVTRAEFLKHTHNFVAQAAVSPTSAPVDTVPVTPPLLGSSLTFPGTGKLRG